MKLVKTAVAGIVSIVVASTAFAAEITGAGASFPAPVYSKWADAYQKATGNKVNYQSIGSSGGIKQIGAKTVDFGASDAPLKDDELVKGNLVQFPTVIGGVVPVINLQGVKPGELTITGEVLANIYLGKIKKWDDPAIKALNPKAHLPNQDILPVRRADGSGTTFIFTNYLSKVSPDWKNSVGEGTTVNWPGGGTGRRPRAQADDRVRDERRGLRAKADDPGPDMAAHEPGRAGGGELVEHRAEADLKQEREDEDRERHGARDARGVEARGAQAGARRPRGDADRSRADGDGAGRRDRRGARARPPPRRAGVRGGVRRGGAGGGDRCWAAAQPCSRHSCVKAGR